MILFIDFCAVPWWLPWLLSALIGGIIGWLLKKSYRNEIDGLNSQISGYKKRIADLEADLGDCNSTRAAVESELALTKGILAESASEGGESALGLVSNVSAGAVAGTVARSAPTLGVQDQSDKGTDAGPFAKLSEDNLQIVEGIGPKMNEVLNNAGISTWSELSTQSEASLREILLSAGKDKYRIIDPSTWAQQAQLAATGKWDELVQAQKQLDGGSTGIGESDSKVEKILIRMGVLKRWKQDDLTAIEGVGPKIAGLLRENGVNTWREVADSSQERLKEILAKGGDRFRLADPGTWPLQAGLAADGKWDELQKLQDELDGGR